MIGKGRNQLNYHRNNKNNNDCSCSRISNQHNPQVADYRSLWCNFMLHPEKIIHPEKIELSSSKIKKILIFRYSE